MWDKCRADRIDLAKLGIYLVNAKPVITYTPEKSQIFGRYKQQISPIQTDRFGRLITVPVVRKSKKISRTQIFGKYKKKIVSVKVDRHGRIVTKPTKVKIHIKDITFSESEYTVTTSNEFIGLPIEDIRYAVQYVYFIRNLGNEDAEVFVEVGINKENMTEDLEGKWTIPAKSTKLITPLYFSKQIRLLYRSLVKGKPTNLYIVFQTQTSN